MDTTPGAATPPPDDASPPAIDGQPATPTQPTVTVALAVEGDPTRICHRLSANLGPHWTLLEARVTARQVYPVPAVGVGEELQVLECTLVRTDGRPPRPDDLPAFLSELRVLTVHHAAGPPPDAGGT